jgi:hypothetical protein
MSLHGAITQKTAIFKKRAPGLHICTLHPNQSGDKTRKLDKHRAHSLINFYMQKETAIQIHQELLVLFGETSFCMVHCIPIWAY